MVAMCQSDSEMNFCNFRYIQNREFVPKDKLLSLISRIFLGDWENGSDMLKWRHIEFL